VVVETSRVHFFDLDSGEAIGGHPVGLTTHDGAVPARS